MVNTPILRKQSNRPSSPEKSIPLKRPEVIEEREIEQRCTVSRLWGGKKGKKR